MSGKTMATESEPKKPQDYRDVSVSESKTAEGKREGSAPAQQSLGKVTGNASDGFSMPSDFFG